ncbi:MAG TPA: hypothetical protein DCG38_07775 [Eubacteriaceae bacterium]|jgi:GT2 family glycosyltransferase|nr:hypothetical protein [Eubacteriaceae bacterium]
MGETKREKVAAVVVTYNRKHLLRECLQALLSQTEPLDEIIVIDNASTDGTDEMVPAEFPQVTYVRLPENIGGAGGFHEGMKLAYEKGHDWIWVMDDDAEPERDTLDKLLVGAKEQRLKVICPLIKGRDGHLQGYHHKLLKPPILKERSAIKVLETQQQSSKKVFLIDANAFLGILINREVVDSVGLPRKEFFIWGDDTEYTYRISRKYSLSVLVDAVIVHKDDRKGGSLPITSFWKCYFGIRNKTFMVKNFEGWRGIVALCARTLCVTVPNILLRLDHKLLRLRTVVRGIRDGLMEDFSVRSPDGARERIGLLE